MLALLRRHYRLLLIGLVLILAGGWALVRWELAQLRDAFEVDARISHRVLSQRAVQHEAVLATLALLQPVIQADASDAPVRRLTALYPQVLDVLRSDALTPWSSESLRSAEARSRQSGQPALAELAFSADSGRYTLVLAGQPASYALRFDVRTSVPWADWSMPVQTSPVRVTLEQSGQTFVVQPGQERSGPARFEFRKHLASESQPFDVVAQRQVGWPELPWGALLLWAALVSAALLAWAAWQRQRSARLRAEGLLRVGQVARLNALGELAAGMAHELNQPLTAIVANTQAARRLLDDDPADAPAARQAMEQAVAQARRAADVVARLRRTVEQSKEAGAVQALDLAQTVGTAMHLLEPQCRAADVALQVLTDTPVMVQAERVAVEQIVHNLVTNAVQALAQVPSGERQLSVAVELQGHQGVLRVIDTGPGIAPEALPKLFTPFFSTREGGLGLGLGLSLCETLAQGMEGTLTVHPHAPRGTEFQLRLPHTSPP
ncbi:ATP-binding protein [Curvibacter sp. APW13]|uniref:sensor histidine kinase n=1 Tax=Curvibacter sp. APW13 TaxID=3077236 RepID=UPI0028DF35D4|nr:ATP-binding protein [Curvibacter sp. APW13]MDT8989428.1 ATP-binding protein [Curvibacter sp. APW13]